MRCLRTIAIGVAVFVLCAHAVRAEERSDSDRLDVTRWALPEYEDDFFEGRTACGADALNFWMQTATYRGDPQKLPQKRTIIERLLSSDLRVVAEANDEIQLECRQALADIKGFRAKGARSVHLLIVVALRVPERLTLQTRKAVEDLLRAVDVTNPAMPYMGNLDTPGGNGSNVHGHLTPLALGPELIDDQRARWAAYWGFRRELDHMNTTGDMAEFNLLESHWTGTGGWELMKRYCSDPAMRRMARMISERLWINRFLTWSASVERNTGPGSRMAPSEWLGCDNERFLLATAMRRPIWLNAFYPWEAWNPRAYKSSWPLQEAEGSVPDLPAYLQDLAWKKSYPNELQCAVAQQHWANYPKLPDASDGDTFRPMKYVNYQTQDYAIGSSTSSWIVNTCYVGMAAFWNNSRNAAAPVGSPARFCALYPHYVVNGMSFLDKGSYRFADAPDKDAKDDKGGVDGPWMREFVEWGRMGILQDRNTMLISYTSKPGHHLRWLSKPSIHRASAGMFLFRWTEGTDGLFINRNPVLSLPAELQPGDWWFIEDGDVYAAVRPLEATHLRGNCKTILEKRTRHIVLYQDNVVGDNIEGITDEDWVKARSGFVVEMGSKREYGSFDAFRDKVLAAVVSGDTADGYVRDIGYDRGDRHLKMKWHCYTEEYASRQINGREDPWVHRLQSPEFAVGDERAAVKDAALTTEPRKSVWLLSSAPSQTWVAYQPNVEQEVPIEFTCPAGRVKCDGLPFGKVVVSRKPDNSILVDIDASYRPYFSTPPKLPLLQREGGLPPELYLESDAAVVAGRVNGLNCKPHQEQRAGKKVWVINPYSIGKGLLETSEPKPSTRPD